MVLNCSSQIGTYTEYQYNIAFPRKKYIRCSNAIVCQNWKFETALECAYQLSIYLGMCIMYTLYIIRCPPEKPHNVMHLADLLKTFSIWPIIIEYFSHLKPKN